MKTQSSRIMIFTFIGVLFLSASSACAKTVEEYFSRGNDYSKQGNFTQAVSDYTKAIEINHNDANIYNNRGLAYKNQGKVTEAISDFTRAIQINPNLGLAYNNRGNAYTSQGNFTQAISDFTRFIQINPNLGLAYSNRGNAYYVAKEYNIAWLDVRKAEELGYTVDPNFITALKKALGRDK